MERTLISETPKKIGRQVLLKGWVNRRRDHGKITFIDLRDRTGIVQVVFVNHTEAKGLRPEDVVSLSGCVKARPANMVNPDLPTGKIEIEAEELSLIARAAELPFDTGGPELKVSLPTLLDYRPLTLRHPKIQAIFRVQATIIEAFREALRNAGFTEFQAPTIVPSVTEGGAQVFKVEYFDKEAYLGQSPQLYKQIMVGIFERVFTLAHAYRAEPSVTTRHITEYLSLDAEMGFIESFDEIMATVESAIRHIFTRLEEKNSPELQLFGTTLPKLSPQIPRLKMRQAQEIIFKRTGRDNRREPDLEPEDEREIGRYALEEYGTELIFITHYPTAKRPFYTFPDPEDPEFTNSFDLVGRGMEWVTGGQRINDYDQLVANIKTWGNRPEDFAMYLQAFKYGLPPEGGFALGAERITMQILGLENIREASLFPRDMERIDTRLTSRIPEKPQTSEPEGLFGKLIDSLHHNKVKYQLLEHEPVFTSDQAAKVRGNRPDQGAKALVMLADTRPVLVVIPASRQLDTARFQQIYSIKALKMASPAEVKKLTGVEVGAVPPFGNLAGLPVYVDAGLAKNKEIVFNAGRHDRSVKMAYSDWQKLVKPEIGSFAA